jgi:hypothetical protein
MGGIGFAVWARGTLQTLGFAEDVFCIFPMGNPLLGESIGNICYFWGSFSKSKKKMQKHVQFFIHLGLDFTFLSFWASQLNELSIGSDNVDP